MTEKSPGCWKRKWIITRENQDKYSGKKGESLFNRNVKEKSDKINISYGKFNDSYLFLRLGTFSFNINN